MADDIVLPGTGETLATDDCGGRHVELIKMAYSADGVATHVPADGKGLAVKQDAGTATLANINDTTSSTQLLASNAARRGFMIHNDSAATLYVNFGATASSTAYSVKLPPDAYYEVLTGAYTGAINGIWSADLTGAARVTELT